MDKGEIAFFSFLGLVGLFVVFLLFVVIPVDAITDANCKSAGWMRGHIAVNLERYCSRRIDQTDVIVPYHKR